MWKNNKFLISLAVTLLVVGLLYIGSAIYQKNKPPKSDSEQWSTYNVDLFDLSFNYPAKSVVDVRGDEYEYIVRIQNYSNNDVTRSMSGKYWVELFLFKSESDDTSCPRNIVDYSEVDFNGATMYRGVTQLDEGSGVGGGLKALCVNQGAYDLYIQGQDETNKDILEKIVGSLQFLN